MLNNNQYNNLIKAIELATHELTGHYVVDNKPACVIGQLAFIEGTSVEELIKWDIGNGEDTTIDIYHKESSLKEYPRALLRRLQKMWDDSGTPPDKIKHAMKVSVDAWYFPNPID